MFFPCVEEKKYGSNNKKEIKQGLSPKINIRAELGFLNDKAPTEYGRKAIYVCFLAERSDGHLLDFRRFR